MARLVPGLVDEFGGQLKDEEIRGIADEMLDTYDEVPIRSFVMTLANRKARQILKQRAVETAGASRSKAELIRALQKVSARTLATS